MDNLHPVFREITQSFFLTPPPPDADSRVDPHAAVVEALGAILAEADGPGKPYDGDSYLPPHLTIQAIRALEVAKGAPK